MPTLIKSPHGATKIVPALIVSITIGLATLGLTRGGWLDFWENRYYDIWHRLAGVRAGAPHALIVAMDDATLLAHQDTPITFWSPQFARALDVLREVGAKAVAIDYLFSVSAESWLKRLNLTGNDISRTYDIGFRGALARGNVALAGSIVYDADDNPRYMLPIEDFLWVLPNGTADVGLTNLLSDGDGAFRRFAPMLTQSESGPNLTLGALLAEKSGAAPPESIYSHDVRWIGFAGPPGTIPRISMNRLLAPGAESDPAVRAAMGKVALIGAEGSASQDIHPTPYAREILLWEGRMMSGVEIHANIVESLITGDSPRPPPFWIVALALPLILLAAALIFFHMRPLPAAGAGLGLGLLLAATAYMLFKLHIMAPLAGAHAGIGMTYLSVLGLRLTGEERQRAHLQSLFGRFVSDAVVEKLIATGRQPDLGGEEFEVTVLFSDIRNFTTISEKLAPREVVEMLNAYFQRACEPILNVGGTVDKFIGDAVMAVFGAPVRTPDHARQALRAALEMERIAGKFQEWMDARFPDRDLPKFRIGIGLHSGQAVVGNIGSNQRIEYTAVGDTVNIASRMESASKELGWTIVATAETLRAAGEGICVGEKRVIPVKGRMAEVQVCMPISIEAPPEPAPGKTGGKTQKRQAGPPATGAGEGSKS